MHRGPGWTGGGAPGGQEDRVHRVNKSQPYTWVTGRGVSELLHSLRIARGGVDTMEERPARPRAELTTTKNLVTRIGIGINALHRAVNKATDSAGTLTGDSTAEEIPT